MISINATLILQVINFLILTWILNKILFKPILKVIEDRDRVLADNRDEMKKLREKAETKSRALEQELAAARKEASAAKDQVTREASEEARRIIHDAENDASRHVQAVKEEAEKEAAAARTSLVDFKDAIVEMVLLKVMGRKV